jgi:hypothetical protein
MMVILDACGGWEQRVEIPSDRSRYGTIDQVSEDNDRILRDIFSGPYPSSTPRKNLPDPMEAIDVQNFEKLQDAYDACLNETVINDLGAKPLLELLEKVIMKYPVESSCHPMKFQTPKDGVSSESEEHCLEKKGSLTDVLEYLQSIGVGAFFSLVVTVRYHSFLANQDRKIPKTPVLISWQFTKVVPVFQARTIIHKKLLSRSTKKQSMIPS